jgi:hypothetical protein
VVVDYDYGKFAGIVLLEEAGYCLADVSCFITCWDYCDYARPGAGRFVVCTVVIEIAETPEHAAC